MTVAEEDRQRAMRFQKQKKIRAARDVDVAAVRASCVSAKANVTLNTVPGDTAAQADLDAAIARLDTMKNE